MGNLKNIRTKKMIAQGGCCWYCGLPMWEGDGGASLPAPLARAKELFRCTAEHLLARSEGGRDAADNIVAACLYCNQTRHKCKHPPSPEAWRKHVRGRMAAGRWLAGQIACGLGNKGVGVPPTYGARRSGGSTLAEVSGTGSRAVARPARARA